MSYVIATYSLEAPHERAVSVVKGELLKLISKDNESWWKVENSKGETGFVPVNYCREPTPEEIHQHETNTNDTQHDSVIPRKKRFPAGANPVEKPLRTSRSMNLGPKDIMGLSVTSPEEKRKSALLGKELEEKAKSVAGKSRSENYEKGGDSESEAELEELEKEAEKDSTSSDKEKSGYLNQRIRSVFRVKWVTSYCVLEDARINFFKTHKLKNKAPLNTIIIDGSSQVTRLEPIGTHVFLFQIVPEKGESLVFEAPNEDGCEKWIQVLSNFCRIGTTVRKSDSLMSVESPKKLDKKKKDKEASKDKDKEKDTTKTHLNKFFKKRPNIEEVKACGILQDVYIGGELCKICETENSEIPSLLVKCIAYLEGHKLLDYHGIYRVAGPVTIVQQLHVDVNQGLELDFEKIPIEFRTVTITSLIKLYLRELPTAIIPQDKFAEITTAMKAGDFIHLLRDLPVPHKETLKLLVSHFAKIVALQEVNQMSENNLAVVFGPTLTGKFDMESISAQHNLVVKMIDQVEEVKQI